MKEIEKIRNIGIAAHIDGGKTTTTERILFLTNRIHKIGEVHEGKSQMDWMEQEAKRGITITSASTFCEWKKHYINLIDTPGHVDFTIEVERSMRVLDFGIILLDSVGKVEPQTKKVWGQSDKYNVARVLFINKMDRVGANFEDCLKDINEKLDSRTIVLNFPLWNERNEFIGIIDVVNNKEIFWETAGFDYTEREIQKEENQLKRNQYFEEMIYSLLLDEEELLEQVIDLSQKEILNFFQREEIIKKIRHQTINRKIFPVLCGSAFKNKGIQQLLDAVLIYGPSPNEVVYEEKREETSDLEGMIFKIEYHPQIGKLSWVRIYNGKLNKGENFYYGGSKEKEKCSRILKIHADNFTDITTLGSGDIAAITGLEKAKTGMSIFSKSNSQALEGINFPEAVVFLSIRPKQSYDMDKMMIALDKMSVADPSLKVTNDQRTKENLIGGMGELHLEIVADRLRTEYKIETVLGNPRVHYKETLIKPILNQDTLIKHQTGGAGLWARIWTDFKIDETIEGISFEDKTRGDGISSTFIESVNKGFQETASYGPIIGGEITWLKANLIDGKAHKVDSNDFAFRMAGRQALLDAFSNGNGVLMEPIMDLEVIVNMDFQGIITGDIASRSGEIYEVNKEKTNVIIKGYVPLKKMFGYSNSLRSMTKGEGIFSMEYAYLKRVTKEEQESIVKEYARK